MLAPGDRSHCRNKVNYDGTLYTLVYGNPCTFHVDPVEKKPLFHFLPGTLSFSLATSGCVFRCLNCQNWEISQKKPEETKDPRGEELRLNPPLPPSLTMEQMSRLSLFPEDAVAVAEALGCPSISYTYSEPTAFYEYTHDTCKAARERKLKNIVVTCGSIEERPARDLYQFADAAHVDLKGFDEDTYKKLNSGKLPPSSTRSRRSTTSASGSRSSTSSCRPTRTTSTPSAGCAAGLRKSWDRTGRCTSRAFIRSTSSRT